MRLIDEILAWAVIAFLAYEIWSYIQSLGGAS